MSRLIYLVVLSTVVIFLIGGGSSQQPLATPAKKEGVCPPLLPRRVCWDTCNSDQDCPGGIKCCGTECGGRVCSRPVTAPKNPRMVKPGLCPDVPVGPWFCSNMCSSDGDCRGKTKCCKNKCGAKGCYPPVLSVLPVRSAQPARPVRPAQPSPVMRPEQPETFERPAQPEMRPAQPEMLARPAQPEMLARPAQPVLVEQPELAIK